MKTLSVLYLATLLLDAGVTSADDAVPDAAFDATVISAMKEAATYYRTKVAVQGGYVYYYSLDLTKRLGEGVATAEQIWVQPPGTPTVGMAFLKAYRATGDTYFLDGAREAAEALVFGQLRSGGWTNQIDMAPRRQGYPYSGGKKRRDGNSSLDDGQTQSAIQLMVQVDEALKFRHKAIHECAMSSLNALLAAQFPNGAVPQVWTKPVSKQPVLKASYPDYDWRTEGRIKNYWDMYTLNDNVCGHVADTLILAHQVYQDDRYFNALKKLGDFLILAQMPDPQPAWSQQYNYQMKPIWARKFEPAGIAGDESQEVIETLMKISRVTQDKKYLAPIPRALAYLKRSLLPDGRIARYYELKTNKPLYMVRRSKKVYELTYDDSNLPKHYGWKWESRITDLEKQYTAMKAGHPVPAKRRDLTRQARHIVEALDNQGRWVTVHQGEPLVGQPKFPLNHQYISSAEFSRNLTLLSEYLTRKK